MQHPLAVVFRHPLLTCGLSTWISALKKRVKSTAGVKAHKSVCVLGHETKRFVWVKQLRSASVSLYIQNGGGLPRVMHHAPLLVYEHDFVVNQNLLSLQ